MGTTFRIVLYAETEAGAEEAATAGFAEVDRLDSLLSDWNRDSELSRVSSESRIRAPTPWLSISPDLHAVLERALAVATATDGAFDPTIGPLTRLWRRSYRQEALPRPAVLEAAQASVGHAFLSLRHGPDGPMLRLEKRDMRLDLGGIAKGSTADAVLRTLRRRGVQHALIDAGGDLLVSGPPPDREAWTVGLEAPEHPSVRHFCDLRHGALATSGSTYRSVTIDDATYSHLIDPRTGLGCLHQRQVNVLAGAGIDADAWASALSVLPVETGLALAEERPDLEARVSWLDDTSSLVVRTTSGFPRVRISP